MKLVAKGRLQPADIDAQLDLCLGCRACETACPAGVKFGRLLEAGRERTRRAQHLTRWQRRQQHLLYSGLLLHLKRLDLLVDLLWLYQASGLRWLVRKAICCAYFRRRGRMSSYCFQSCHRPDPPASA